MSMTQQMSWPHVDFRQLCSARKSASSGLSRRQATDLSGQEVGRPLVCLATRSCPAGERQQVVRLVRGMCALIVCK